MKTKITSEVGPGCLLFFGKAMFILIVALILFSCKSVKTKTNDQSSYRSKDSIRTVIIERVDSFFVHDTLVIHDTLYTQQEKNTNIQFGAGGGTYNAITGEATNVTSLSLNETILQLQIINKQQASTIVELIKDNAALNEKISKVDDKKDVHTSVKETPNDNWYWWLITGAVLMFALIFTLNRIPATRWLLAWLKL